MTKPVIITEFEWTEEGIGINGRISPVVDGQTLNRIASPNRHQAVYLYDAEHKHLQPVIIVAGTYLSNGRVSNAWEWLPIQEDLTVGEKESGYGNFYRIPDNHQLDVSVHIDYTITRGKAPTE